MFPLFEIATVRTLQHVITFFNFRISNLKDLLKFSDRFLNVFSTFSWSTAPTCILKNIIHLSYHLCFEAYEDPAADEEFDYIF